MYNANLFWINLLPLTNSILCEISVCIQKILKMLQVLFVGARIIFTVLLRNSEIVIIHSAMYVCVLCIPAIQISFRCLAIESQNDVTFSFLAIHSRVYGRTHSAHSLTLTYNKNWDSIATLTHMLYAHSQFVRSVIGQFFNPYQTTGSHNPIYHIKHILSIYFWHILRAYRLCVCVCSSIDQQPEIK